ncbi:MAG: hypothetical protein Q9219_002831 [cf. Caloplaca sp. 3 TL-2023]
MAPSPPQHRASAPRRRWIWGVLLILVTLIWILYPSKPSEKPGILHRDPVSYDCGDDGILYSVAIIGAGSAGASAAYYLNKFKSPCQRINITIYERNSYVGGRSTTVNIYGDPAEPAELGASIFVKVNHNLVNAAKEFSLPVEGMGTAARQNDKPEVLGIWNGQEFVFTQSDATNKYWNLAKLLWKYGYAPIRTQNLVMKTVGAFLKMYQPPYFPFTSLAQTASDLDLLGATAATGKTFLQDNSISELFAHDIIQASTRVNYAQNLDQIHGLETMVCMATDGAMSIQGGNWQIFASMIDASGATLLLNTSVTQITKDPSTSKYSLKTETTPLHPAQDTIPSSEPVDIQFDSLILAAPLQYAAIAFTPPLPNPPPPIPYVSQHVTLFTSPYALSPEYFNLPPSSSSLIPTTILTTTSSNAKTLIPFYSISTLRTVTPPPPPSPHSNTQTHPPKKEYLYKIFSPTPLNTSFIRSLLDTPPSAKDLNPTHQIDNEEEQETSIITWLHRKQWDAYPYLPPRKAFEDIRLDKGKGGIYYTSGIEAFISTMETSSLMGANVASLVLGEVGGWGWGWG